MAKNKKYMIDPNKCPAVESEGWAQSIVEDNGWLLNGGYKDQPEMVKFVKNRLPKLLSRFYDRIIDEAIKDGVDEDYITEAAEEYISGSFGSILLWLVGQVDPDALKEEK